MGSCEDGKTLFKPIDIEQQIISLIKGNSTLTNVDLRADVIESRVKVNRALTAALIRSLARALPAIATAFNGKLPKPSQDLVSTIM